MFGFVLLGGIGLQCSKITIKECLGCDGSSSASQSACSLGHSAQKQLYPVVLYSTTTYACVWCLPCCSCLASSLWQSTCCSTLLSSVWMRHKPLGLETSLVPLMMQVKRSCMHLCL